VFTTDILYFLLYLHFADTVHSYQAFSSIVWWLQKVDRLRWISTVWSWHVCLLTLRYIVFILYTLC